MSASRPHGLSKSRYCTGLQCPRQLWWRTHEPAAPELTPDAAQQAIFDTGSRVGEVARNHVPGGVLIDRPYQDYAGRLADTQAAIESGARTIYEASFSAGGVFIAADILTRDDDGWRLIEVKSSTQVKPQHLPDAAVQLWVLRQTGLVVTHVEIMVLDRACTHPDLSNLFQRVDVTAAVEALLEGVPEEVTSQLAVLAGPLPEVTPGPHCRSPYPCPFMERCWPPREEHALATLYNSWRAVPGLLDQGYVTILDLPAGLQLNAAAERQRRSVQQGGLLIEGDLAGALAPFVPPLAYLDFETVSPAIPVWPGTHPYDAIAVQFSVHQEDARGGITHTAWVATTAGDPRPELARRLIAACAGARAVVAYNAPFEKSCIERLAKALPQYASALRELDARIIDLLPVVRDHVYHPAFGGSFSLKAVLPALVPDLRYDGLVIAEGTAASAALDRLIFGGDSIDHSERVALERALLAYCELDTLALVRLLARLREWVAGR